MKHRILSKKLTFFMILLIFVIPFTQGFLGESKVLILEGHSLVTGANDTLWYNTSGVTYSFQDDVVLDNLNMSGRLVATYDSSVNPHTFGSTYITSEESTALYVNGDSTFVGDVGFLGAGSILFNGYFTQNTILSNENSFNRNINAPNFCDNENNFTGYCLNDTQLRVYETCPVGSSIRVVYWNGSVECESDSEGTNNYVTGISVSEDGDNQTITLTRAGLADLTAWFIDNNSAQESVVYNASTVDVYTGTLDDGDVNSLKIPDDGDSLNVSEVGGTPAIDIRINYTSVEDFNFIVIRAYYGGKSGHEIQVCLYDYDDTSFECEYGYITDNQGFVYYVFNVFDATDHISGGVVQLSLNHTETGNPSHDFYVDYAVLVNGYSLIVAEESDPLFSDWLDHGSVQFHDLNVTSGLSMNGSIGINVKSNPNYWLYIKDHSATKLYALEFDVRQNRALFAPMHFKNVNVYNTSNPTALILYGEGGIYNSNSGISTVVGSRLTLGSGDNTQASGTRVYKGQEIQANTGQISAGTRTITGYEFTNTAVLGLSGVPTTTMYGAKFTKTDHNTISRSDTVSYGLYLDNWDVGTFENSSYSIWVDEGDAVFKDKICMEATCSSYIEYNGSCIISSDTGACI